MSSGAAIQESAIKQLFTDARTYNFWLPKEVSDETLHGIYDLMKWGPTSANAGPARIVFVKTAASKEKFISAVSPMNVDKVKSAPVTAIIAHDTKFYEHLPKLFPHAPDFKNIFINNAAISEATAFRNGSLQGAYFMMAARAMGVDCGPMSGFDNKKMDELFLGGTDWKSNFICNIGYGDKTKLTPRLPRLSFDEACKIV